MFRRLVLIACVLVCFTSGARASERTIMQVDFSKPIWSELLTLAWGSGTIAVEDGTLRIDAGTAVTTPGIFCRDKKIIVSLRIRCAGIEPNGPDWKVGRAVVHGFDAQDKECCHQDVALVRGDRDWTMADRVTISLDPSAKTFRVRLANEGKSGSVWFDDFTLVLADDRVEELIGDGGFEGALGVDHWYFQKVGADWDNIKAWKEGSTAEIDADVPVAGKQCLRLSGPATVVSKPFPYHGEKLVLSGWLRHKDLVGGGYCKTGVQLAGFDANGKQVSHCDLDGLIFNDGTKPWAYYYGEFDFNAAVKSVQVWLRLFDGATGTAWFDQYYLGRIPPKGAISPFDAAKAAVAIDAAKPGPVINHQVWAGTDLSFACWLLHGEAREWLDWMKKAGIERIRMHEFNNAFKIYTHDNEKGEPQYDWSRFDAVFDPFIREYRFLPVISLETTPDALDRPGTRKHNWINTDPPADLEKWSRYIEAVFDHAIDRYGKDEVAKWYWEVWNEPGFPSNYFTGTPDDLAAIAEADYRAAERVEKRRGIDLKMGLTSGGGGAADGPIIERLRTAGFLDRVDHYSFHLYCGWSNSVRQLPDWMEAIRGYPKRYPGLRQDCIVGNTEWNATSMNCEAHDRPWDASMVVKYTRIMLDEKLDYGLFFNLVDHPELNPSPPTFAGYHGMLTKTGVPKPVYNAFVFLNELRGGKRLGLTSSNDPVDGIAVRMPDGSVRIVLTNFDEDTSRQPCTTAVTVTLAGLGGYEFACTRLWAADETHGNSYARWLELGKPGLDDADAKAKMIEASRFAELPPVTVSAKDGQVILSLDVPGPGIRFLELQEVRK